MPNGSSCILVKFDDLTDLQQGLKKVFNDVGHGGIMLVGRNAELAVLDQVIAAVQPALILITSESKMDKSSLLRELRQRAEAQHYCVLAEVATSQEHQEAISIHRGTTKESFCQAISMTPTTDSLKEEATRPTLILIDGYRPQKQFEYWFIGDFIPRLKETSPPYIVVVAAYTSDVKRLAPLATSIVDLKPIAKQAVEAYLRTLNNSIQNKMEEDEIQAYAAALQKDSSMIDALERLLSLESSSLI
jgi:hypothetical protein